MNLNKLIQYLYSKNYDLSDIQLIIEGYFNKSLNRAIIGDEEISDDEYYKVISLLDKDYPPAYLAKYIEVMGLKIFVDENVLIPRTETIDFILDKIKNNYDFNNKKVLDLCTGSGVISLLLKKIYPSILIKASDISLSALSLAKKSASYNHLNIEFIQSDFLNDINESFDYIISNPPYIEIDNKETFSPFEPELALYSGKDGLDSYRSIFLKLDSHLNEGGTAFFEIETSNLNNLLKLKNEMLPSYKDEIYKDMENKERYLILYK